MTDTLPPGVPFNAPPPPPSRLQVRIVPPPHHPTSDVRPENLSQSEAREILSDWVVYRFEKATIPDGTFDTSGYPVLPSWDHVRRCRIGGLSKREISKEVRDLDKKTSPVAAKKAALSDAIQNQLDMAHDHLAQNDHDPRYRYVLSQLDCELRQRDPSPDAQERPSRGRGDGRRSSSARPKSKSKSRKSKSKTRKTFERVSVTAYFKRCPRRDEDAVAMCRRRDRDHPSEQHQRSPLADTNSRRASSVPDPTATIATTTAAQPPSSSYPPSSPHSSSPSFSHSSSHSSQQQHHHHHHYPRLTYADQHRQRRHSQLLPVPVTASHRPSSPSSSSTQVDSRHGNEIQAVRDSPKTSQSSFTDDDFDISDNELTPQSSVDGSPLRQHNRQTRFRSRSRSRDRPRPPPRSGSTSPAPDSPRRHSRDYDNYVWTSAQPPTSPIDIRHLDELDRFCKPSRADDARRATDSWERGRRHDDDHRKDEGDEAARQQDRVRRRRSGVEAGIEVLEHPPKPKHHSDNNNTPPLSQPSRVNRRRASVRIIAPGDVDQVQPDGDLDRHLERLRIDDERQPRRADKVRFRDAKGGDSRHNERRSRRSVDFTARHPDEIFHMEDDVSWDERAPNNEYKRRSSSSEMDRNPFTGRPITRRISEYR